LPSQSKKITSIPDFQAVTTIAKFSNLASLTATSRKRRSALDALGVNDFDDHISLVRNKRQVLAGGVDTSELDTEMESFFFKEQGASNVTLNWIR